jgi:hypothetical protein
MMGPECLALNTLWQLGARIHSSHLLPTVLKVQFSPHGTSGFRLVNRSYPIASFSFRIFREMENRFGKRLHMVGSSNYQTGRCSSQHENLAPYHLTDPVMCLQLTRALIPNALPRESHVKVISESYLNRLPPSDLVPI